MGLTATWEKKHYHSAHNRMFESVLSNFLYKHVPQIGGQELINLLSKKIIELFNEYNLSTNCIKPGQMVWTAVDKNTRPDSKNVRYKPIILTLINDEEITFLEQRKDTMAGLLPYTIARMLKEAFAQGTLISMRDIAIIIKRHPGSITNFKNNFEEKHQEILPTPGSLQDMGSSVTHKAVILRKILLEKKDMNKVRQETYHTQQAIDRYLKDYRRVEMLLDDCKSVEFISKVTKLSSQLVLQYKEIYLEYKNVKKNS